MQNKIIFLSIVLIWKLKKYTTPQKKLPKKKQISIYLQISMTSSYGCWLIINFFYVLIPVFLLSSYKSAHGILAFAYMAYNSVESYDSVSLVFAAMLALTSSFI